MIGMRQMGSLGLAIVLGATLVACGSDSNDEGLNAGVDAAVDGDLDLSDFTGECAAFVGAFAGASAAIGSAFGGAPSEDLEKAAEYFKQVTKDIPDEIRADFEVFANAYEAFANALVEANIDFTNPASMNSDSMAELERLANAFSAPEVEEASANVEAYLTANCSG